MIIVKYSTSSQGFILFTSIKVQRGGGSDLTLEGPIVYSCTLGIFPLYYQGRNKDLVVCSRKLDSGKISFPYQDQ